MNRLIFSNRLVLSNRRIFFLTPCQKKKTVFCMSLVILLLGFLPIIVGQEQVVSKVTDSQTLPPNILFILVDQWRASAFGHTGDPNVETPQLDRLASQAVRFTNAVSVCPVCTPWRAAFLTGRFPTTTGMFKNDIYLPSSEYTIAEDLRDKGYDTAYIGKWHLDGHGRLAFTPPERRQGFDYWKGMECTHDYNNSLYYEGDSPEQQKWEGYDSFAQTRDAEEYLKKRENNDNPFFLMISYGTPHFPHQTAPEEYQTIYRDKKLQLPANVPEESLEFALKEAIGYYAHCSALDKCIGELLATLDHTGLASNTLVVFTSDHGEMLGAHGYRPWCKHAVYDESAGIPLFFRLPGSEAMKGRIMSTPITTPDLYPTILGLAGMDVPPSVEGLNLAENIRTGQEIPDRAALVMAVAPFGSEYLTHGGPYRAIRTSRYTYAVSTEGTWLLFDREKDPLEMNNLANLSEVTVLQEELQNQLEKELSQIGDPLINGVCRDSHWYETKWQYEIDSPNRNIPFGKQKGVNTRQVQSPIPLNPPVFYTP